MAKQTRATQWLNNATQDDINKLYDDFCNIKNEDDFRQIYPFSTSTARNFLRKSMPDKFGDIKKDDDITKKMDIYDIMMRCGKGTSPISLRIANDVKQDLDNFLADAENTDDLQSLKRGVLVSLIIRKGIEALKDDYFDGGDD